MAENFIPKYPSEFFLEFRSVDRYIYRVSDLYDRKDHIAKELVARLDSCHLYFLCTRPRLSLVPGTLQTTDESINFEVEYRIEGRTYNAGVEVPRNVFLPEEQTFEISTYPHHGTLQKILADINSNEPDNEAFALVYALELHKNALFCGTQSEVMGDPVKERRERAMAYQPTLEEQISLVEASSISYFKPATYNTQYLNFPHRKHQILASVYAADFAAIIVQLDNTHIGGQRIYSKGVTPSAVHHIVIDFRHLEGKMSFWPSSTPSAS